jgi:hypothetical protein
MSIQKGSYHKNYEMVVKKVELTPLLQKSLELQSQGGKREAVVFYCQRGIWSPYGFARCFQDRKDGIK